MEQLQKEHEVKEQRLVFTKSAYFMPAIMGVALIIATGVGAYAFLRARSYDHVLSVTGSATKQVTADRVKWVSVISRPVTVETLKDGYIKIAADKQAVTAFLTAANIPAENITVSPVSMDEVYDQYNSGPKKYTLRQTFEVAASPDISTITNLSKNISPLIDKGVIYSTQSLEYYYSGLPEARVSLLADALKDARARAQTLASSSGTTVGPLVQAASGVVQVLPKNSVDISDYGAYDTSSIDKTIMVTVKASFSVK